VALSRAHLLEFCGGHDISGHVEILSPVPTSGRRPLRVPGDALSWVAGSERHSGAPPGRPRSGTVPEVPCRLTVSGSRCGNWPRRPAASERCVRVVCTHG
jgi:hypothetical protein